jgi:predicted transcriptional regulator
VSTTSLKLSEELKLRAAAAAQELGISPHAFMVEAIRQATDAAAQRAQFVAQASAARDEMQQSGLGLDTDEVSAYLRKRLVDQKTVRPNAKSWRK